MILLVFIIITILEMLIIRSKYKDIKGYINNINGVGTFIHKEKYTTFVKLISNIIVPFLSIGKYFLCIPIFALVVINLIISLVLGGLLNLIF